MAGDFFLRVVVHGASGVDLSGDEPTIAYRGPEEHRPDYPILKEAERESDHHGAISWILGADTKAMLERPGVGESPEAGRRHPAPRSVMAILNKVAWER